MVSYLIAHRLSPGVLNSEFLINGLFCIIVHLYIQYVVCISGTARTSLIVTIGPSPRHRGETTSTILFGQRVGSYYFNLTPSVEIY